MRQGRKSRPAPPSGPVSGGDGAFDPYPRCPPVLRGTHATPAGKGWLDGGSPTKGFLSGSAAGPLEDFYRTIAGTGWANTLFMLGLLGIGVALLAGIGMRIAPARARC
ncbi:MAG: hypothetical protein ACRDTM_16325 [Micromonosporaceae bacterium]